MCVCLCDLATNLQHPALQDDSFKSNFADNSLSMQPNVYFHSTYSVGSVSKNDSLADESLSMQPNVYLTELELSISSSTFSAGSVNESYS